MLMRPQSQLILSSIPERSEGEGEGGWIGALGVFPAFPKRFLEVAHWWIDASLDLAGSVLSYLTFLICFLVEGFGGRLGNILQMTFR